MAYDYVLLRSAQVEYTEIVKYLIGVSDGLQTARKLASLYADHTRMPLTQEKHDSFAGGVYEPGGFEPQFY